VILDAGFLVSVDRGERDAHAFLAAASRAGRHLHTTEPVVAQVWRQGARQARLARLLSAMRVHPLDDGRPVGQLLARTGSTDVVDAHVVVCAVRLGFDVLTGDTDDLTLLANAMGSAAPVVHAWP
jgi:hypothetical protein